MCLQHRNKFAFLNHGGLFPQPDELLVEIEDGIRIGKGLLRVDLPVVLVHAEPGGAGGESGVRAAVPLHGGAAVVAAPLLQDVEDLLLRLSFLQKDVINIRALHVAVLADVLEVSVGHAKLFSHVDIGCAAHEVRHRSQHLRALFPVFLVVAESGKSSRLVVVVEEQRVPGVRVLHAGLPAEDEPLQLQEIKGLQLPFLLVLVVHLQMMEGEDHAQLVGVFSGVFHAVVQRGR